jgi:cobalt-zinc-cadmium efflux system outer membrane protein
MKISVILKDLTVQQFVNIFKSYFNYFFPMEFLRAKTAILLIFFLMITLLPAATPVKAEEINLEQALQLFYKNNYDILINKYEIDKVYGDVVGAKLFPNPNFSFSPTGLKFRSGLRKSDDTQLTYTIQQLIEIGGKRGLRIESATATLEATKFSQRDTIRNLLIGFYTVFYNLQQDQLNIDFARYDLERFEKIHNVAERRFSAGFLSLIDFTKINLSKIDLENNLTNFDSQGKKDTESFSFLLGSETLLQPSKLVLQETHAEYSESALVDAALKNRTDLQALQKQSEAARNSLSLAKTMRIPDVTVGGEYETFGTDNRPRVGASISIPLPLFNRNQGEIYRRNAEWMQVEEQIKKARRQILSDIRQALNTYQASLKVFEAYQARKKEMDDLLKKSEEAFSLGGVTVLDLLDTRKTYRDFITKYNQALTQMVLNQDLLKLYTGEIK